MNFELPSPWSLPPFLPIPGSCRQFGFDSSELEHRRWCGGGTVGFEGRSVLLGLSHVQGKAPAVTTGH